MSRMRWWGFEDLGRWWAQILESRCDATAMMHVTHMVNSLPLVEFVATGDVCNNYGLYNKYGWKIKCLKLMLAWSLALIDLSIYTINKYHVS